MSKELVSTYIFKEKGFKRNRFKINCTCDICERCASLKAGIFSKQSPVA